jgi:hypothetical protein
MSQLHIDLESLCHIIEKSREFQAKEEVVLPDGPTVRPRTGRYRSWPITAKTTVSAR